jgi:hypothetical protein
MNQNLRIFTHSTLVAPHMLWYRSKWIGRVAVSRNLQRRVRVASASGLWPSASAESERLKKSWPSASIFGMAW